MKSKIDLPKRRKYSCVLFLKKASVNKAFAADALP
jgi:hypothetical protein